LNYRKDVEYCLEFIERNIKKNLTSGDIAKQAGYSLYHFSRVFNQCMGLSISEYIRKRRLSLAARELFNGRKIIDIAVDYHFKTASGFSKSFRKTYGYSPSQYIKRTYQYTDVGNTIDFKNIIKAPDITKKAVFKVAGYGIKTNINQSNYTKDIASYWKNYEGENLESKMYDILNPAIHAELGLHFQDTKENNLYLLGVIVNDFSKADNEMFTVTIPEAEYAVFTTPPVDTSSDKTQTLFAEVIASTWKYIFEEWFKGSGYVYDMNKMDFEFYDERCHFRKDTVMDIYIPIKKKNRKD
jgi:AraC family transcriptional regulator